MIKGQIIIKLSDGSSIAYANKYLAEKTGDDGLKPEANLKFAGFPEYSYYYTGFGDDRYSDQLGAGKIKGDYDFLLKQVDVAGNEYLRFPEIIEEGKATNEGNSGDTTLVRNVSSTINSGVTKRRLNIAVNEIVSISVSEEWVNFPYGRESGYNIPKASNNFYGFNETEARKAKGVDRGPDFDKYKKYSHGYIPAPIVYVNSDGKFLVKNKNEYKKIIQSVDIHGGNNVYGIVEVTRNGALEEKKSASTYIKGELAESELL